MTRYLLRPALLACTLALAGCYTVLQAPRGLVDEVALPEPAGQAAPDSGSVPDGSGTDAQWADLYDYPGVPSGYGGGYGYGGYTRGSEVFFYGAAPYPYYSAYPYYSLYRYGPGSGGT